MIVKKDTMGYVAMSTVHVNGTTFATAAVPYVPIDDLQILQGKFVVVVYTEVPRRRGSFDDWVGAITLHDAENVKVAAESNLSREIAVVCK